MTIRRTLTALANGLRLTAARGLVSLVDDARKAQQAIVRLFAGEVRQVERLQNYGFTSVPLPPSGTAGAEAVVVFLDGDRGHGIVVVADDRRYRLKNLASGEVAVYDDQGQRVHFKRNGAVEVLVGTSFTVKRVGGTGFSVVGDAAGLELKAGQGATDSRITLTPALVEIAGQAINLKKL